MKNKQQKAANNSIIRFFLILIPMAIQCMENSEQAPLLPRGWDKDKKKYEQAIRNKHSDVDIEFGNLGGNPQARAHGIKKWCDRPVSGIDCLTALCAGYVPIAWYNMLAAGISFAVDQDDNYNYFIGSIIFLATTNAPVIARAIHVAIHAQNVARRATRHIQIAHNAYTNIFSDIRNQKTWAVQSFLQANPAALRLDEIIDGNGNTILVAAIKDADPDKDPKALIIKRLIAEGASLWYENPNAKHNKSISPGKLEQGARTLPHHGQPIIMMLDKEHLREEVLRPLCTMAQQELIQRERLSHSEKIIRMLLMDTEKESGKDEE